MHIRYSFCYSSARLSRHSLPLAGDIPLYAGDMEADLAVVSRDRQAEKITGGLSFTSKMPCPSWGISATRCRVGGVLSKINGTTCHDCYALKGHYTFPNVTRAQERRYNGLFDPLWTPAMVFLIRWYCDRYFRFFDSGDIQGDNHLRNIVRVAAETPQIAHWLPTREIDTVRRVLRDTFCPENLVIRASATRIDGKAPRWPRTSTVVTEGATCPAAHQGNSCGDCRACWDASVKNVSYPKH